MVIDGLDCRLKLLCSLKGFRKREREGVRKEGRKEGKRKKEKKVRKDKIKLLAIGE